MKNKFNPTLSSLMELPGTQISNRITKQLFAFNTPRKFMPLLLTTLLVSQMLSAQLNDAIKYHSNATGFYENKGQIMDQDHKPNAAVKYLFCSPGFNVQLRQTGFSYDTYTDTEDEQDAAELSALPQGPSERFGRAGKGALPKKITRHFHRVDIELPGCNPNAILTTEGKSGAYYNYLSSEGRVSDVHCYQKVTYKNIYPDMDLEFSTTSKNNEDKGNSGVEYNFVMHPGGNPTDIKLAYKGADKLKLEGDKLIVSVTAGDFTESIPASYLVDRQNLRQSVQVSYAALGDNVFAFSMPSDLGTLKNDLVIDPTPYLAWGTYYGGTGTEYENQGIGLDAANNVYIDGATTSASAIATTGAYRTTYSGGGDGFIAKFNAAGTSLIWSTYYGGPGGYCNGIAIDASDNVYVTGQTASTSGIATTGAYQTTNSGGNVFVAKFNSSGTSLLWGTYYAGPNNAAYGIAVDASNNVYITGLTTSASGISTTGAYRTTYSGGTGDGYIAKFNSSGTSLLWGTYYGGASGSSYGACYDLAVDASGNVYVCGTTQSASGIATTGAYQTTYGGGYSDAFAAKFSSDGSSLLWGTYYGGTDADYGSAITIDISGNVYIGGYTASASGIATPGAYQTTYGGGGDTYVAKFNATGTSLIWGTYYGGSGDEGLGQAGITLDAGNNVFITGTSSGTTGIATAGAYQTTLSGTRDAYVAEFSSSGAALLWGTYFGGGTEITSGIALDASNNIYITGYTASSSGIATPGAYQTAYGGGTDAFVAKFTAASPVTGPSNVCIGSAITLNDATSGGTWSSSNFAVATVDPTGAVTGVSAGTAVISYTVSGSTVTQPVTVNTSPTATATAPPIVCNDGTVTVTVSGAGGSGVYGSTVGTYIVSAGTYTFTITDGNGCSATTTITLVNPILVTASATAAPISSSGGTTTVTVSGSGGTGVFLGTGTYTVSAGIYTYTATDGNGCTASTTITILSASGGSVCVGSTITLDDTAPGGTWTSSNTAVANVDAEGIVTGVTVGTATISYIADTASETIIVTVNALPTISAGAGVSICNGSSTTLTATGGSTYSWAPSTGLSVTTGASVMANPAATTIYTVTGFNACSNTSTVTVTVNALPTVGSTVIPSATVCAGTSITLNGTGASTYSWTGGVFDAAPFSATTTNTYTVTGTDVNGCSSSATQIVTVLAPGTIFFDPKVDFNAGSEPIDVAIGDIDGDGKPDMVVANYGSSTVSVYRNISSAGPITAGSFADKVDFATGSTPWSVAIADIDGDGKPDIVVANEFSNTVSVLRNTSTSGAITTGSFAAKVDFSTGSYPVSIAVGDIDGDGKPDLVVTNEGSTTVSVFRNTSTSGAITTGSFAAKVDFATGLTPLGVAVGDIDGDGKPDLVVADIGINAVSVLRNTSTSGAITSGSFAAKVDFYIGDDGGTYGVALGDIDGDGKPDLAVTNEGMGFVSVLRNTSASGTINSSSFASEVDFATGSHPQSVAIGDLDGDGKPELVVLNQESSTVSVFRNTSSSGAITAGSFAAKVDFATGGYGDGVAIGDMDGDGKPDLAVANFGSGTVSVLHNDHFSSITGSTILCQGSTITLSDATTGGVWSSSNAALATIVSSTGVVSGIAAGTPTITYTSAYSCIATVTVTINSLPSISASAGVSICNGASTTLTATGGSTYSWDPSTGLSATTGASVTANPATTIAYTVTGTNANSCSSTAIVTVTVNATPNVNAVSDQILCNSEITIAFLFSGSVGGTTFNWTNNNTSIGLAASGSGTIGSFTVVNIGATDQVATITVTPSANGCTGTSTNFTITVHPATTISASPGIAICSGSSTTLTAAGGDTYSWSPSMGLSATTGASVTANPSATTIYTVFGTNSCGTGAATVTVSVNPIPIVSAITGTNSINPGATTPLSDATSGGIWASSNTGIVTVSSTGVVMGVAVGSAVISYSVTASGCTGTANVTVTVNSLSGIAIFNDNYNRASFTSGSMGGTPATTYTFTQGGTSTINTTLVSGANYIANIHSGSTANRALFFAPMNVYSSPFNLKLSSNPGMITWTFNMRTNTAVTTSSPTSGVMGGGIDLCSSAAGNIYNGVTTGYGVVFDSGAAGGVNLIRFSAGMATNVPLITGTTTMSKTDYYSVMVTYNPATNQWSLYTRDDGAAGFADPSSGVTTQQGSTITDATYTGVSMVNFGALYTFTAGTGKTMSIDNYTVSLTECSGTPAPGNTLSAAATVCAGNTTTLSLQNSPLGAGVTYQWHSAPDVSGSPGSYTAITGATNATYTPSAISATTWFTCSATCTLGGSTGTSNPVQVVVYPLTTISGPASLCNGATATLSSTLSGGTWSGSNTLVAIVGSGSGIVSAVSAGTANISYTTGFGCVTSVTETVNPAPGAISIAPATNYTACEGNSVNPAASAIVPVPGTLVSQNFNSGMTGQVGGTWAIVNTGAPSPYNWAVVSTSYSDFSITGDGTPFAYADPDEAPSTTLITSLITPGFSTVGYTSALLTQNVYCYSDNTYDLAAEIDYSTNGGTTWTLLYNLDNTTTGSTIWTAGTPNLSISLPAAALGQPNVQIRWYYNTNYGFYWAVDNVVISASPSPLPSSAFTWTGFSGATGLSCTACASPVITPASVGVNVYSVTATFGTCSTTSSVSVTVNPLPTISAGSGVSICSGSSTTLAATGGSTYSWSPSTGLSAVTGEGITANPVSTTTYSITGTDANSCTKTATVVVTVNPLPGTVAAWQNTGTAGFSAGGVSSSSIAIDPSGTPYVVYEDGANGNKATVMKYNGSSWVTVGSPGFSAGAVLWTSIAINGSGTPYVVYVDAYLGTATVMKYNGSSWLTVGSAGFSESVAPANKYTTIAIDGSGTPYVAFGSTASNQPVVMKYNGSNWVTVGSVVISYGSVALYTSLAIDASGTPYVVYQDAVNSYKATVLKYNGSSWETVGSAGFSAGQVAWTSIAIDGSGTPYVVYSDEEIGGNATVMKFNGSSWVDVGSAGFSTSYVEYSSIAIDGSGAPYVVYQDDGNGGYATVMKYNGSSWITAGSAAFSAGPVNSYNYSIAIDGSGTPYVVYSDGGNSGYATVMQLNTATIPISGANTLCAGSVTTLSDTTAGGVWNSSTPSVATVNYTSGIVTGVSGGTDEISYTLGTGCTATVIVTVNPQPAISAGSGVSICTGSSTTLSATSGLANYSWSPSTGLSCSSCTSPVANPTVTTTYMVTDTDANGCSAIAAVTVTVLPLYTITSSAGSDGSITPSGATNVCSGSDQAYTITPNIGYYVSDVQIDGSSAGAVSSYTFSSVSANHMISAAFAIDTFTIAASSGTGGSISSAGSTTVGYGSSETYTFTPATGYHIVDVVVDGVSVGAVSSYTFSPVTAGHTISVTYAPDCIAPAISCSGNITQAADAGVCNAVVTYSAATATGTSPTITYSQNSGTAFAVGITTVTATASNGCGTADCSFTVTVNPNTLIISTSHTNVSCNGGSNGAITTSISGGTGSYSYSWSGGASGANPTGLAAGTYTVTVTDAGCAAESAVTAMVTITQPAFLAISTANTTASCYSSTGTVTTTVTGGTAPYTYLWSNGATTANLTAAPGTYSVTATDANGCTVAYTTSVTVTPRTVTVRLVNSTGAGISGAAVQYYNGSWMAIGTTDVNGYVCMNFPTSTFSSGFTTYFQVLYAGGVKEWSGIAVASNPVLVAQTTNVSWRLEDHTGALITSASGTAGLYTGSWGTVGTTGTAGYVNKELLPGSYYLNMNYSNYTQQLYVAIGTGPTQNVNFQTTLVTLNLLNHTGALITSSAGTGGYYSGGWYTMGSTGSTGMVSLELLPGSGYYFNMNFNNYTQQQAVTVTSGPTQNVNFQTTLVTLNLLNHTGTLITGSAGTGGYYSGGWYTLGSTGTAGSVSIELLPGSGYYFNMNFNNYTQQQAVTVTSGPTQNVNFQTTLVTLNLLNHTGSLITSSAGTGGYYSGGWYTIGSTGSTGMVSLELLPGSGYYFNMNFNNYTQQQAVTVTSGPTQNVNFQTTLVTLNLLNHTGTLITGSAGTGGYYSGGWYTMGSTGSTGMVSMELLPGSGYYFNMNYNNYTQQQAVTVSSGPTQSVNFQTTLVTLNLEDHTGALITSESGTGGYYSGGWYTMGSTGGTGQVSKELLPGSGYYFNMNFHNGTQQIGSMSVTGSPWTQIVNFQTALVNIHFQGNSGIAHSGATIDYYSGGWYPLGTTDGSGNASKEMLPVPYYYNATLTGYGTTQIGSFTDAAAGIPTHIIQSFIAGRQEAPGTSNTGRSEFAVYPNPTEGTFNVEIPTIYKDAQVVVSDLNGKILESRAIYDNDGQPLLFSLNNVARGIYVVKVFAGDVTYVEKIIAR